MICGAPFIAYFGRILHFFSCFFRDRLYHLGHLHVRSVGRNTVEPYQMCGDPGGHLDATVRVSHWSWQILVCSSPHTRTAAVSFYLCTAACHVLMTF